MTATYAKPTVKGRGIASSRWVRVIVVVVMILMRVVFVWDVRREFVRSLRLSSNRRSQHAQFSAVPATLVWSRSSVMSITSGIRYYCFFVTLRSKDKKQLFFFFSCRHPVVSLLTCLSLCFRCTITYQNSCSTSQHSRSALT